MGIKTYMVNLSALSINESIRLWVPFVLPKISYKYEKLNKFIASCEAGKRPKGGIKEEDKGEAISLGAEQIGEDGTIDLSKTPYVSYDFYESTRKGKIKDTDILICKDGALTGKTCFVDLGIFLSKKVMINEHIYILRGNNEINQKFLFYYTRNYMFQSQIKDLAYRKKAQPGLNSDHFKRIKIPLIPKPEQDKIISRIEPNENKIAELRQQIKEPQAICDTVFAKLFKIDIDKVNEAEQIKYFFVSNNIAYRNLGLRTSVRWNKIAPIQTVLYKNNPYIEKLGKYLISTRNGWSPICRETDIKYLVFGVDSISKDAIITYNDLKASNQLVSNIEEFFVKNNDLFVSRGNTVELVALASIVKDMPDEKDIIFPDLFIRLEVDEEHILKEYLAYVFNSIIGRFYFKYASKGKNQTMVKISSDELNNFYLPVPPIEIQRKIINEIKGGFEEQLDIRQKIEVEKNKIDLVIDKAIR